MPVPLSDTPAGHARLAPAAARPLPGGRRAALGLSVLGLVLLGVAGCGQRGPLYLPDPNDPTKKRS